MKGPLIGVDLGGTNVRAGLVDRGRVQQVEAKNVRAHGSKQEVLEDLYSVIDAVFSKQVKGIGLGVPSLVDKKSGMIFDTTNIPAWKKVPLKKLLEKRYRVPVCIDNDANCFALGEKYFGAAKNAENFVGLILGTGLGAGIVSRGKLHSGIDGGAGEFGLIPYRDSIIEHYASGQFFKNKGLDGEELFKRASGGDTQALWLFEEYGSHLAHAIQIILYSLAPELIVFGGSVSQAYPFFKNALNRGLADFAYDSVKKKVKFKVSKLRHSAILGAASLVTDFTSGYE